MSGKSFFVEPEFAELFEFKTEGEQIDHEARVIMFRFLSEIEKLTGSDQGFKKRLARTLKVSQSYITQLYNGDKLINLKMLAKLQKDLGITFQITAIPNK